MSSERIPASHSATINWARCPLTEQQRLMDAAVKQAREEIDQERFRARVEAEKVRLRTHRSLWDRLFPFAITIQRKK